MSLSFQKPSFGAITLLWKKASFLWSKYHLLILIWVLIGGLAWTCIYFSCHFGLKMLSGSKCEAHPQFLWHTFGAAHRHWVGRPHWHSSSAPVGRSVRLSMDSIRCWAWWCAFTSCACWLSATSIFRCPTPRCESLLRQLVVVQFPTPGNSMP